VAGGAKPNDLAAIQVNPNSTDWILAKVISQDVETGMFQLADEDVESNKGEYSSKIAVHLSVLLVRSCTMVIFQVPTQSIHTDPRRFLPRSPLQYSTYQNLKWWFLAE